MRRVAREIPAPMLDINSTGEVRWLNRCYNRMTQITPAKTRAQLNLEGRFLSADFPIFIRRFTVPDNSEMYYVLGRL